jgi:hypothetical protein
MRVMVLVKASHDSENGVMPTEQQLLEMGSFNEKLVNAGVMLAGEGLHPTSKAKRVRFENKKTTVIDGPFAETKELLAGYWVWKVGSIDEAVDWVRQAPFHEPEAVEIEIRPIFEMEDFGDAVTDAVRQQEDGLRTRVEQQQQ